MTILDSLPSLRPYVFGTGGHRRPLIGPLRVVNKLYVDDTGPRRVLFYSWFPALRILRDDPMAFTRQLDDIVAAGYQGIRIFIAVGGWDYWRGREVAPVTFTNRPAGERIEAWPDFDDLWRLLLQSCRARQLRLHVTTGDAQIIYENNPTLEVEINRKCAALARQEGGTDVIAVWEAHNEYWQNSLYGNSPEELAQDRRILDAVKAELPDVLTMRGSLNDEEPSALEESARIGEVCAIHQTRQPPGQALRRTFGLYYWEGHPRHFPKPFWYGEPGGIQGDPPGNDVYAPLPSRAWLVGLYALMACTGYAVNYFDGTSVRNFAPIGSVWGFWDIPRILDVLPEDIGLWGGAPGPGGAMWYWITGKHFATVWAEGWKNTPPWPIATWTIYGPDAPLSGTGDLPWLNPGFDARFIVGTFR